MSDDAKHLRVKISESQANWAVNVGSIDVWANTASVSGDATGPVILVDGVQAGDTYEAPHPAAVSIIDDQSGVTEQSVALNGADFSGGQLTARGRNVLSASATSEGGVITDATLEFEVVDDERDGKASIVPSDQQASVGDRIEFRVEDTTDEGRWIDGLEWAFGDGTSAEGWWAAHSYDSSGTYTVTLTATDQLGYTTTDEVKITVE